MKNVKQKSSLGGLDPKWLSRAQQLKEFYKKYKRWPRPKDWLGEFQIGQWLYRVRHAYFDGKLGKDRSKFIRSLGYEWEEIIPEPKLWLKNYDLLQKFLKSSKGRWPNLFKQSDENEKRLARWTQAAFQRFKKNDLKPRQIKMLKDIGFDLKKKTFSEHFETQFKRLMQFRKKNPDRWPGYNDELPKGNNMGLWCKMLRDKKKLLPPERIARLEAIGFPWDFLEFKWDNSLVRTIKFIKKNRGNEPTSVTRKPDERKLALWLTVQRGLFRHGKLGSGRKRKFLKAGLHKKSA